MKQAVILINAYSRLEHSLNQSRRLKEEFEARGVHTDILRNDGFFATIGDDGSICNRLRQYDFCVYLDKDKYVSQLLERSGMRLFNRHDAIVGCDDKMTTAILLSARGIPVPKTLPGLLCYDAQEKVAERTLRTIESELGFPVIVKHSYGSLGNGVFKADDFEQLRAIAEDVKCSPHLFQRFVRESAGRDMRVIVIGGKYAAAMERRSAGDFRSNLELGGTGRAIEPSADVVTMCERVAALLQLDYCGIDVLFGKESFYVCEVNSNAFFGGMERATDKNIAALYAEHMLGCIYG